MSKLITNRKITCHKCKKINPYQKRIPKKGQLIYCGSCLEKLEIQSFNNTAPGELEREFERFLKKIKQSRKKTYLLPKDKNPGSQY